MIEGLKGRPGGHVPWVILLSPCLFSAVASKERHEIATGFRPAWSIICVAFPLTGCHGHEDQTFTPMALLSVLLASRFESSALAARGSPSTTQVIIRLLSFCQNYIVCSGTVIVQ